MARVGPQCHRKKNLRAHILGKFYGISKFLCLSDCWLTVPVTGRIFTVSSEIVLMSDK